MPRSVFFQNGSLLRGWLQEPAAPPPRALPPGAGSSSLPESGSDETLISI